MKTLKGNVRHRERLEEVIQLSGHPDSGDCAYDGDFGVILKGMYERALDALTEDLKHAIRASRSVWWHKNDSIQIGCLGFRQILHSSLASRYE